LLRKRSFTLSGHATSVALEPEFWAVLEAEAAARGVALAAFVAELDLARGDSPLASACRVAALGWALKSSGEAVYAPAASAGPASGSEADVSGADVGDR
jgi:predicted DNA-binding ribbon-helix-helix protein